MAMMKHTRLPLLAILLAIVAIFATACDDNPPTIGILEPDLGANTEASRLAFLETLKDAGYKAGDNVRFHRRNYEFRDDPYDELADYLANEKKVDIFFAMSPEALDAIAKVANGKPIVYAFVGGVVNRPPNTLGVSAPSGAPADYKALGNAAGNIMAQLLKGVPIPEVQVPSLK